MKNIIGRRKRWYLISGVILTIAIIALAVFHLRLGIDFTGGSELEIEGSAGRDKIEATAQANHATNVSINTSGVNHYLIRYRLNDPVAESQLQKGLKQAGFAIDSSNQVGPSVSRDIIKNGFLALGALSLAIVGYVTYAFRKVPKRVSSVSFGMATVVAAFAHDALFVLGAFALLGKFLNVEIDAFIITAILTVIGFSIHDTIVVFDRIREKLKTAGEAPFEQTVETSLQETLVRSLNTSLVIIMVLLALFLFGGGSTRYFILALLLGMVSGTYSSIFVASPLLVDWHNKITLRRRQKKSKPK